MTDKPTPTAVDETPPRPPEPTPPPPAEVDVVNGALYDWSRHLPETAPAEKVELPTHKADLVALAIDRGIASYIAWDMTVPELTKKLED